jgi:hypothetical protein
MADVLSAILTDEGLLILTAYGLACAFLGFLYGEQNQRNKG